MIVHLPSLRYNFLKLRSNDVLKINEWKVKAAQWSIIIIVSVSEKHPYLKSILDVINIENGHSVEIIVCAHCTVNAQCAELAAP